jgi:hypothetical protein
MTRTLISAEAAREFLRQMVKAHVASDWEHPEYRRGAASLGETFDAYLSILIDDPTTDLEVRDAA